MPRATGYVWMRVLKKQSAYFQQPDINVQYWYNSVEKNSTLCWVHIDSSKPINAHILQYTISSDNSFSSVSLQAKPLSKPAMIYC